jgi:hypothetical protein
MYSSPILHHTPQKICHTRQGRESQTSEPEQIAKRIARRISFRKCEDGYDACDVADGNLPGSGHGTVFVAVEVHREPAENDWCGAEDAHGVQDQACVLNALMVVDREKDHVACDGQAEADYDEGGAVSDLVGEVSDQKSEHNGGGPWRHGEELASDWAVAIGRND